MNNKGVQIMGKAKQAKQEKSAKKHTLEVIVDELRAKPEFENAEIKDIDNEIYTNMLISFVDAADDIIGEQLVPTPLFRAAYDDISSKIEVLNLKGTALPQEEGSIDFDALDFTIAMCLRNIPLAWVGETGTGKTRTSKAFGKTIFPRESYNYKRMAGGAGNNSVIGCFTQVDMSSGYPRPVIDYSKTAKMCMLFIDEFNRGKDDEKMQLIDGEIAVGGKVGELGPEIPTITQNGVIYDGRKKKTFIVGAKNPDCGETGGINGERQKYTGARGLDDAEKNRWLSIEFGDITVSAGQTINQTDEIRYNFPNFAKLFKEKIAGNLGIDASKLDSIEEDWLSLYAYISDTSRTEHPKIYSAFEFEDTMALVAAGNFSSSLEKDNIIIEMINETLYYKHGFGFSSELTISDKEKGNSIMRLEEILTNLQAECPRDINKVGLLANGLKTMRDLKKAFASDNPVETYKSILEEPTTEAITNAVNIADVAYAWTIVAQSRALTIGETDKVVSFVNEVINDYTTIEKQFHNAILGKQDGSLEINDGTRGIKNCAIYRAFSSAAEKGKEDGNYVSHMIKNISDEAATLCKLGSGKDLTKIMVGRYTADLATFCSFLDDYDTEINTVLGSGKVDLSDPYLIMDVVHDIYKTKKKKMGRAFPAIYEHRIPKTLGLSL